MSMKLSEYRNINRRVEGVTMPIRRKRIKWQRNWLCLCDSGKKYKNCCMKEMDILTASDDNANIKQLPEDIQKMIDNQRESQNNGSIKNG